MASGPPGSMPAPPSSESTPPSSDPSWEGDRMFNIYIYDYCTKRGFRKTARELLAEADIPPDSSPPINARQGLLFEWWSVFWVLFNAKSNNTGTDDAIVYTQHQLQQQSMKQAANSAAMRAQQTPMNRMINGNPGPMQNGAQVPISFPMPAAGPQPNGIPMPPGGPAGAGANPGQPQNFNPMLSAQRAGPGPQHRGPNGVNPYQSPTMAHSPQNPGGNAGPNPQHPQAPMGQLGPSPHMAHMARGGMLPPNSSMGSVPSAQTPPFAQLGRSPSRPGTPGQGMIQPSPSMMNRAPPLSAQEANLNNELSRIPTVFLTTIRQELGLGDKDLLSLPFEEKNRIIARARNVNPGVRKPGPPGSQGTAGPSNPSQGMQHAAQRGQHPQQQQMPPQQPPPQPQPQQPRVIKRNSTSPGEEHGTLPNNESSPPDRKRARRNSGGMDQPQPVPQYGHPPQQQGAPQMQNGMLRPGPGPMGGGPMNAFQAHGPPGMAPGMGMPMGAPQMGNGMNPGMGGPQNIMMGQMQYRANMHAMTKSLAQAHIPGGGGGTPGPGDPSFNPGQGQPPSFPGPQNNRVGQNKPMSMMPPPSPAGGPSKEQSKDVNKAPGGPPNPGHPEGSPRNQQASNPAQGQPNPSSSTQGSTAPPTPSATSSSITAPSPSAVVNGTPTINPATQPATSLPELPANFLTPDFMQSIASSSSLDDFDPQSLFRPEDASSINFEQDFREWFNPDDLDMK